MRRLVLVVAIVLLALLLAATAGLVSVHRAIRALAPELPSSGEVLRVVEGDLPVRLGWINTASQAMPRSAVLEPDLDPDSDAPYVMSHASFALEWADGRIFLIDLGMDRESAEGFGRLIEWTMGAAPIEPLGTVAEQLGDAARRVAGVGFTHLHTDHVSGIDALCRARSAPLPWVQTRLQAGATNFTTRPGRSQLDASCAAATVLKPAALQAVPGFPGLHLIEAAGHTPGSQLFIAQVRGEDGVVTYVFTGDIVNHVEGVRRNLPKPHLYSLLVVPEAPSRLEALRLFLAELEAKGARLLVSHDQRQLEASGVARIRAEASR